MTEKYLKKKIIEISFKWMICFCFLMMTSNLLHCKTVTADNSNPLLEGIEIKGPDYIFEFEGTASFTLDREGYLTESETTSDVVMEDGRRNSAYDEFKYKWKSSDTKVAKFTETLLKVPSNSCVVEFYPALSRPNLFQVNAGTTTISCTISDGDGNKITLTKKLVVLKGSPFKKIKIGTHKLNKSQRYSTESYIYTNERRKKAKVQVWIKKNWEVKKIRTYCYTKKKGYHYKNITKSREISLNSENSAPIEIYLRNKKTGQEFYYICKIKRYTEHEIRLGRLRKGCAIVSRKTAWDVPLIPRYTLTISYKKNSKASDPYTFKSAKDLVQKLKKYHDYTDQTIVYKNGKIIYKEVGRLEPWYYCRTEKELDDTIKRLEKSE